MRAVVQRVDCADVKVENNVTGKIDKGLLVFLGVGKDDTEKDLDYLVDKIIGLRIFEDENGKMNLSVKDINGKILAVSQFTLYGDCRKGKRPSFDEAASFSLAKDFYEKFIIKVKEHGIIVETGIFQSHMLVSSINNGPVTMLIDSKKFF